MIHVCERKVDGIYVGRKKEISGKQGDPGEGKEPEYIKVHNILECKCHHKTDPFIQ